MATKKRTMTEMSGHLETLADVLKIQASQGDKPQSAVFETLSQAFFTEVGELQKIRTKLRSIRAKEDRGDDLTAEEKKIKAAGEKHTARALELCEAVMSELRR